MIIWNFLAWIYVIKKISMTYKLAQNRIWDIFKLNVLILSQFPPVFFGLIVNSFALRLLIVSHHHFILCSIWINNPTSLCATIILSTLSRIKNDDKIVWKNLFDNLPTKLKKEFDYIVLHVIWLLIQSVDNRICFVYMLINLR